MPPPCCLPYIILSRQALISQADLDAWVAGRDPVTVSYTTHWQGPPSTSSTSTSGTQTHRTASRDAATSRQAAASPTASPADALVPLTLFSLNDYLGLASHPEVCEAAETAARQVRNAEGVAAGQWGEGGGGSADNTVPLSPASRYWHEGCRPSLFNPGLC